jgi:hypothetical protein
VSGRRRMDRRPALFDALWSDPATGRPLQRATRSDLAEAHRLWWKHRDLREQAPTPNPEPECLEDTIAGALDRIALEGM